MTLLNGPRLVCPYCYSAFQRRRIVFRCTGRPGPAGAACESGVDQALKTHLGITRSLPPVFEADGGRAKAVCPHCTGETGKHACPTCHAQLPVGFGRIPGRLIALVGARESGKTVFMTVLIHELMNRVGARFGAGVSGSDDHTRQRFRADYEAPLYEDAQLLAATRRTGVTREPLVFRFSTRRPTVLGPRPQHTLLSFFDTAGEDLSTEESVETNLRYLQNADGVIVLLDPLQMPGARRLASPGTRLPGDGRREDLPVHMLERVTEMLMRRAGRTDRMVEVPIAVCFTKIDALWHELDTGSPLRRPQPEAAHYDETDGQDVHAQIQQLLHRWDGGAIDGHVATHYRRARYFGLSALGSGPTGRNEISGGVRPYRVADPFLWLLSDFDVIRSRKRG